MPFFGWHASTAQRPALQSAYRIRVARSPEALRANQPHVWDSGTVASNAVNSVRYAGPALAADTRYYWDVQLTDELGQTGTASSVSTFEVGLLRNEDWTGASWVRRDSQDEDDYTLFRKTFELPAGEIARATIYLSACHKYELWVNGTATGKGPAYHQPQFQYYNAYDVAASLHAGPGNALAVFTHWWGGGQGRPKGARGLIALLVVHYANGRRVAIGTDETWRQHRAEQWELGQPKRNRTNGIGYVEKIHADRILVDWQKPSFDDRDWAAVAVVGPQPTAPWTGALRPDLTRVTETAHEPVAWTELAPGHYLADFGQVRAGYPVLDFAAAAEGRPVTIRGGYTLEPDGHVSRRTAQKTDLSSTFIHDGRALTFRPAEYLGMRYLEIENAPVGFQRSQVHFVSRHYELNPQVNGPAATFASNNPKLDAVWQLMMNSVPVGTQEEFIDTPTREKGGFLNDAWAESVAAMLGYGDRIMTRRVLQEFLDSEKSFWPGEGRLNDVYPYDRKEDIPDYTQNYLEWVWDYYLTTGDTAFLADHFAVLSQIGGYVLKSRNPTTGLIHELAGGQGDYLHGIIDWPKSMRYGYDVAVSANTVINAHAYADLQILAQVARVLGKPADAARFAQDAADLRSAMNARLVDASGRYTDGLRADGTLSAHFSQQANSLPLAFGIVPDERRSAVLAQVKSLRMSSGLVTVRMLVEAIGESGDAAHLVDLFTNETWDGWAKSLARGATCTWESWSAIDGNESLSHGWGAIGLVGYTRYILGVTPLEPQYAKIRVRPLDFGSTLTHAEGTLPTDRGAVRVAWRRTDEHVYRLELTLPNAMTAEVWIPASGAKTVVADGKTIPSRRDDAYLVVPLAPGQHVLETR